MKKMKIVCAAACAIFMLSACSSSKESAYKKAYEKAEAQEQARIAEEQNTPTVEPLVEKPATQTTVYDNTDNATVRQESLTLVSGSGLHNYSVVVGSFSLRANAEGLQNTLKAAGYDAQIAYNSDRNMYRVIASSFDDKASAVRSRDQLRSRYADAWLLYSR